MLLYHLTPKSNNAKLGPDFAVSTSAQSTCPDTCPLKATGCYAKGGPLSIHWAKISSGLRGVPWSEFLTMIRQLPSGRKFRHNQAGDLPPDESNNNNNDSPLNHSIDGEKVEELTAAVAHLDRPFTYTHKCALPGDIAIIKEANSNGFTINASCDTAAQADALMADGVPCTLVVESNAPAVTTTPAGRRVVVCPEQQGKVSSCAECMLCSAAARPYIIGFRAHGSQQRSVNARLKVSA